MGCVFHDITLNISENTILFPGDPRIEFRDAFSTAKGDICNVSAMTFGSHTGTHIDAPRHLYDSGMTVDRLPLNHFVGKARVFEITGKDIITAEDLRGLDIKKDDIILLKTRNSFFDIEKGFNKDYAYIASDAARYLTSLNIKTLGFDYLSVDRYDSEVLEVHNILLGQEIVIIEGLVLKDIKPGDYYISALPLKIEGGNGSPVRAVLIEED